MTSAHIETYSAETSPKGFVHHLLPAFRYPAMVYRHRSLLRYFFVRDLLSRFRDSALGLLWVLIHPIFLFAVYYVVFGHFLVRGGGGAAFAVWLFSGLIYFHAIMLGTNAALGSIVTNGNLVRKVAFPCELLPLVPILVEAAVFLVGCCVLLLIGAFTGQLALGWGFLLLPLQLLIMVTFATGLGMLLANLYVFARDVRQLYAIFSTAWFFLSPIFWWPEMLYQNSEWLRAGWLWGNPLFGPMMAQRQLFGVEPPTGAIEGALAGNLALGAGGALVVFLIGYASFMANKQKFADLV